MKGGRFISALMSALFVMLSVSSGQAQQKQGADDGKQVLAVVDGKRAITEREVDDVIGSHLFGLQEKIYALRKEALESLINRAIIEEQARAKGESVEAFLGRLAPERVHIKQTQIEQVYAESAGRYAGLSEDEAKQRIRLDLETRERMAGFKSAIAELRKKARVEFFLSAPSPPAINIAADGPSRGPEDAPVTIIEFSDFQCPYCKQASSTIEELIRAYGDNIRVVFKHLPLPIHADAFKAAQAAACADEQGKFWEYHDRLFNSADLTTDSLRKHAAEIGLKAGEFNSCLESESSRAVVVRNLQQARQAGIQGTPTFIINGVVLRGARGIDDFKKAIDEQLRASNAPQSRQRGSGN